MIADADEIANKTGVIRSSRLAHQSQAGLLRTAITLFTVTGNASGDQVFPRFRSLALLGNDMVDRHLAVHFATVLTLMIVSPEDIPLRQNHSASGRIHVALKPHNAGYGKLARHRSNN